MARQRAQDRERYANGKVKNKPRKVVRDERMDTVLKQRMRYLAAPGEPATDRRYGSFLGKLCLQNIISLTQWDAAERYEEIRRDYLGITTEGKQTATCQLAAMVFGSGRSTAPEIPHKRALTKEEYHNTMIDRLEELDRFEDFNAKHFKIVDLLDRVTIQDMEIALTVSNVTALRTALNVLARYFQFVR